MGWKVNDLGDVRCAIDADAIDGYKDIHAHNFSIIGQYCAAIYDRVKVAAESNDFLLMLGGDHSIPVGTIPAILSSRPQTGVLWVDAHADINTTQTSPSGNMHGMPVAMLMGLEEMLPSLPPFDWFSKLDFPANRDGSKKTACLSAEDLVYVGLREVDEGERALIKDLGIKAFTMADVDRIGIGGVMKEVKDHFESRDLDIPARSTSTPSTPCTRRTRAHAWTAAYRTGRPTLSRRSPRRAPQKPGARRGQPAETVDFGRWTAENNRLEPPDYWRCTRPNHFMRRRATPSQN